jgi:hypothetical protein
MFAIKGRFLDNLMSSEEIKTELDAMDSAVAKVDKLPRPGQTVIRPAENPIITLQDIRPDQWGRLEKDAAQIQAITVTDAQWSEFLAGKHYIYILFKARYGDESLHDRAYWDQTFCGYYVGTTAFWHNCTANKIDRVTARR